MLNRWLVFILVGMLPACLLDCDSASAPVDDSGLDAGSDTAPGNDTSGDGGLDVSNPNNRNDATIDFEDCFEQPTDAVVVNESDPFASNNRCDCSCTLREAIGRVDPGGTITLDVDVSVVSLLVFPRNISLLGQDHVITAADQFNAPGILLWFEAASATVRDLTIVASQNVAIRVDGDDSLVQNVQIDDASIGILASGTGVILSGLDLGSDPLAGANGIGVVMPGSGTLADSTINGSRFHGVVIPASSTTGTTTIENNTIGESGGTGVVVQRSDVLIEGNTIFANDTHGILLDIETPGVAPTEIVGNKIGTDPTGALFAGNGLAGIEIARAGNVNIGAAGRVGETCEGPCNVISGNRYAVHASQTGDLRIKGNMIGVDSTGQNLLDDGGVGRPSGAGIIIGTSEGTTSIDTADAITQTGFVRRDVGGACARDSDCLDVAAVGFDLVCERESISDAGLAAPGGTCTAMCLLDTDCATGSTCSAGMCRQTCGTDADCRSGYTCGNSVCVYDSTATPGEPVSGPQSFGTVEIGRAVVIGNTPRLTCDAACNVIAGLDGDGVVIPESNDISVIGNFIGLGTDDAVTLPIAPGDERDGVLVYGDPARTDSARVRQNIIADVSGTAVRATGTTTIFQNWIGLDTAGGPKPVARGVHVATASADDSSITENTIGNSTLEGIVVSDGVSRFVVSNNSLNACLVAIRVFDSLTNGTVSDNSVTLAGSIGIAVGMTPTNDQTQMSQVLVSNNTIDGDVGNGVDFTTDTAGVVIYGCTACEFSGNTITNILGSGVVLGRIGASTDFAGTLFSDNAIGQFIDLNTVYPVAMTADDTVSGIRLYSGENLTVTTNTIVSNSHGLWVGSANVDPDFRTSRVVGNTFEYPLGVGVMGVSGFGLVVQNNTFQEPGGAGNGLRFLPSNNELTSMEFNQNAIFDQSGRAIFLTTNSNNDIDADLDVGPNTVLNYPTMSTHSGGLVTGTTNFAGGKIHIYSSTTESIDRDLFAYLGECTADAAGAFVCPTVTTEPVRATVTGRYYTIQFNAIVTAGELLGVTYTQAGTPTSNTFTVPQTYNPTNAATWLATQMRATFPGLLAAAGSCYPNAACVHVVVGYDDTISTVLPATGQLNERGHVNSEASGLSVTFGTIN